MGARGPRVRPVRFGLSIWPIRQASTMRPPHAPRLELPQAFIDSLPGQRRTAPTSPNPGAQDIWVVLLDCADSSAGIMHGDDPRLLTVRTKGVISYVVE